MFTNIYDEKTWLPVNFDPTKTVKQVNINLARSDGALPSSQTSKWSILIIKGQPLSAYKDVLALSHDFAMGHIVGAINF